VLECEAEDPSATGARNLDWQAFAATLDELAQAILEYLADGRPLRELAQVVGMSRSGIQRHKNRLTEAVQAFMGPELMQELQRPPQWRINIRATRERLACRYARSLA
jgi:DNA-directed RNA polymerase specialized sigma24 family protein